MAKVRDISNRTQSIGKNSHRKTEAGNTTEFNLSALKIPKRVSGASINKHTVYRRELHDLEITAPFIQSSGMIQTPLPEDFPPEQIVPLLAGKWKEIQGMFRQINFNDNPICCCTIPDGEASMILLNWIDLEYGNWIIYLDELEGHPQEIQQAVLSGLYIMVNKLGVWTMEDHYRYQGFLDEGIFQLECEMEGMDEIDEETQKHYQEAKEEVEFLEQNKVHQRLKFYPEIMDKYARKKNDFGDWLRTILYFQDLKLSDFSPIEIRGEDGMDPVDFFQSRFIAFKEKSHVIAEIADWNQICWNEGGFEEFADYAVVSPTKGIVKRTHGLTKEECEEISIGLHKMFAFDIENLKYMPVKKVDPKGYYITDYKLHNHAVTTPSPLDYRTRRFSPKGHINHFSKQPQRRKENVRGNSPDKRQKPNRGKRTAVKRSRARVRIAA